MTAREYFEYIRACQRSIDRRLAIIASMRARESVRAQTYDAIGHGTSNRDAMRATDLRMDAEKSAASEIRDLTAQVDEGRELCRGIRAANITQRWQKRCAARTRSMFPAPKATPHTG